MKIIFTCIFGYILLAIRYYQYIPYSRIIYYNLNPKSRLTHSNLIKQIFLISIYIITFLGFLVFIFYFYKYDYSPLNFIGIILLLLGVSIDRYMFWKTAFYGLEDLLFAGTIQTFFILSLDYFLHPQTIPYLSISYAFGFLASVFLNAGLDKLKSSDWNSGKGTLIWMLLPQFRLFKLNSFSYRVIRFLSPFLSRLEIFHQLLLPIIVLISLVFGTKIFLIIFLSLGLLFMITLIYPFNLNPIAPYGILLLLLIFNSVFNNNLTNYSNLLIISSLILTITVNIKYLNINTLIRLLTGHMKCGLFTEYHMHGLLLLDLKHKYNRHIILDLFNSRIDLKRIVVNNQSWVNLLRLLDVLERAKKDSTLDSDIDFLVELAKIYKNENNIIQLKFKQLNWNYKKNIYNISPFKLTISTDRKITAELLLKQKNVLPYKTKREAVKKGKYGTGYSYESSIHGHN